jgi:hypothetical protein
VADCLESALFDYSAHFLPIAEIRDRGGHLRVPIAGRRSVVNECRHPVAGRREAPAHGIADEASPACDQNSHLLTRAAETYRS